MTRFYTSDTHFFHKNVLSFEDRPYETVEEMNEGIIKNWNSVIGQKDTVHHLGDFCFGGYDKWKSILDQLNGNIILYKGNHDASKTLKKLLKEGYFEEVHVVGDYFKIKGEERYQIWLSHYPMEIGLRPNKFSLHGHIHSIPSRMLNQINVGVDSPLSFGKPFGQPISEEELITYLDHINPIIKEEFQKEREKWFK